MQGNSRQVKLRNIGEDVSVGSGVVRKLLVFGYVVQFDETLLLIGLQFPIFHFCHLGIC